MKRRKKKLGRPFKKNAKPDSIRQRKYNSRPEQRKRRVKRTLHRRRAVKSGRLRKGDKRELDHGNRRTLSYGSTRVMSRARNRAKNSPLNRRRRKRRK